MSESTSFEIDPETNTIKHPQDINEKRQGDRAGRGWEKWSKEQIRVPHVRAGTTSRQRDASVLTAAVRSQAISDTQYRTCVQERRAGSATD